MILSARADEQVSADWNRWLFLCCRHLPNCNWADTTNYIPCGTNNLALFPVLEWISHSLGISDHFGLCCAERVSERICVYMWTVEGKMSYSSLHKNHCYHNSTATLFSAVAKDMAELYEKIPIVDFIPFYTVYLSPVLAHIQNPVHFVNLM